MFPWSCCLAVSLLAGDASLPLANFDGPNSLKGWTASDGGSLALGPGHVGHGAVLTYALANGGSATVMWTPAKPIAVKHRSALSLWVRSSPQVKLAALVRDRNRQITRYPFEAATLENQDGGWRQVVIPLAAEGRIASLGISAEARFPATIRGTVTFDDI